MLLLVVVVVVVDSSMQFIVWGLPLLLLPQCPRVPLPSTLARSSSSSSTVQAHRNSPEGSAPVSSETRCESRERVSERDGMAGGGGRPKPELAPRDARPMATTSTGLDLEKRQPPVRGGGGGHHDHQRHFVTWIIGARSCCCWH